MNTRLSRLVEGDGQKNTSNLFQEQFLELRLCEVDIAGLAILQRGPW
jgi:hypothetical protein